MKKEIQEMLAYQDELNNHTNGVDWKSGKTNKDKVINWARAIYMESAELVDSFPWKHWKNIDQKPDWNNARIEIIDNWHFLMSLMMEKNGPDMLKLATFFEDIMKKNDAHVSENQIELVRATEKLMAATATASASGYTTDLGVAMVKNFALSLSYANISFKDLMGLYYGKNVLNKFRQDNGYKEGTYKKEWNGKEDNVFMYDLVMTKGIVSKEALYEEMEKEYNKS